MRRLLPVLLIVLFAFGLLYYMQHIDKQRANTAVAAPVLGKLTIYTDIPSAVSTVVAKEYEARFQVKVELLPLTEEQMAQRLENPLQESTGDVVITSMANLQIGQHHHAFQSLLSESSDLVSDVFKDPNGYWVGTWFDPVVFVENEAYFIKGGKEQDTWGHLAQPGSWTVVMPDFFASAEAANILYSIVEVQGEEQAMAYFSALKPHVVQYSKFLSTPIRLASLQEADIGIGPYSDARQYAEKHYPVKMLYPQDGTPFYLTGVAILKGSREPEQAHAFIQWLLSKEVATLLDSQHIYFMYTNPELPRPKDALGHELVLLKTQSDYTIEGQKALLKRWVQRVRF